MIDIRNTKVYKLEKELEKLRNENYYLKRKIVSLMIDTEKAIDYFEELIEEEQEENIILQYEHFIHDREEVLYQLKELMKEVIDM